MGRTGYTAVRGGRWQLEAESGEPPNHDEEPTEELSEIARTVYGDAVLANQEGGQGLFQAVLYVATKEGGSKHITKFTVGEGTTPDGREERAKASFMDALTQHCKDLYSVIYRGAYVNARALEGIQRTLPGLIELRLDAIDDRAEAMLEGLGERPKKRQQEPEPNAWQPAADSLREVLKTFGPAVAMKSFGLTIDEAKALFGSDGTPGVQAINVKEPAANASLRDLLVAFGESLSAQQKPMLLAALDAALVLKLQAAAKTDNDLAAATLCAEVLDTLKQNEAKATALEKLLSKSQRDLLTRIVDTVASTLDAHGIEPKD